LRSALPGFSTGLEGSLGGSLAGALKSREGLSLTDAQLGLRSSVYLAGAVLGSIVLGALADRFGRRKLFFWTFLGYLAATAATGAAWNLTSFTICRFLTGAGIGGEYAAVNSAIDELIPARVRGRVDIAINGTFWLGIVIGSAVTVVFLSGRFFPMALGWRLAFLSGLPIGIVVLALRRSVPESPRWLLARGRVAEAYHGVRRSQAITARRRAFRRIQPLSPFALASSKHSVYWPAHTAGTPWSASV
jgi:MFS family permease